MERKDSSRFVMSFLSSIFTPSEDYNYKIIFWSYFALSIAMIALFVASKFWKDIEGFWVVVRIVFGLWLVALTLYFGPSLLRMDVGAAAQR